MMRRVSMNLIMRRRGRLRLRCLILILIVVVPVICRFCRAVVGRLRWSLCVRCCLFLFRGLSVLVDVR